MKQLFTMLIGLSLAPCAEAFVCQGPKPGTRATLAIEKESCEQARQFSEIVERIQKRFGGPNVTMVVGGTSHNAGYDMGHLLLIPRSMVMVGNYDVSYGLKVGTLLTAVAHEYGHAIFQEHFQKAFPNYKKTLEKFEALSDLRLKVSDQKLSEEAFKKAELELSKDPDYPLLLKHLIPYSEFFADVVAVYYFDSKSAMVNSLYYDQMSDREFQFIKLRDFSSVPKNPSENDLTEVHAKLAFARAFVGSAMWPKTPAEAKKNLDKILKATMSVIREDIEAGIVPDTKAMNDRLIKQLKSELKTP